MLCLCAHAHMYPQASPDLSLASCGPSAGFKIELPLPDALPSQFELFHSARQTLFRAHPLQLEKHLTRAGMSVSLCVTPEQCCTWEKPRVAVCRMRTAGSALLSLQRTAFERRPAGQRDQHGENAAAPYCSFHQEAAGKVRHGRTVFMDTEFCARCCNWARHRVVTTASMP